MKTKSLTLSFQERIKHLIDCMVDDTISIPEHVEQLKNELFEFASDINFKKSKSMGDIIKYALDFIKRNYEDVNMKNFY